MLWPLEFLITVRFHSNALQGENLLAGKNRNLAVNEEEGKDAEEEECLDEWKMQKFQNNGLTYLFPLNEL